jgi:hypothetical protein
MARPGGGADSDPETRGEGVVVDKAKHTRESGESVLLPQHAALIRASAISDVVAEARGYRSLTTKADAARLGFNRTQQNVPALLVPVWTVVGEIGTYQLRPDLPRVVNGKAIKYESPSGSGMVLDVPPMVRPFLGNPAVPLFVTEGARKADAAVTSKLACVALLGVWNWRGRNPQGGSTALPDWESVALKGRTVYVVFDSDVMGKTAVAMALRRLKAFLESRGAVVKPVYLPPLENGAKQGLDDFFAAGGAIAGLLDLAENDLRPDPSPAVSERYAVVNGRICEMKRGGEGVEPTPHPLCNFTAEIIEEVVADDGASERGELVIVGSLADGTPLPAARVARARFQAMKWPFECWGPRAITEAGLGNADKLRAAIQTLSPAVEQRRVFEHPGWRDLEDGWAFLHAGGAIGADGPVGGVEVELKAPAALIRLPDPPSGEQLREAVRASLAILDLAPLAVTAPLLGAAYRAPLITALPADVGVFFVGPTGSFKSELAGLLMAHFGAGFDRLHLPGSWSATANYLERLLFDFKDCPVVLDDFAPSASHREADKLHGMADRLFRGVGNASGRGRLTAEAAARPVYSARGFVVSTGEDEPRGHSIRARLVVVEVEPGDVDPGRLTACQRSAAAGVFAAATAGYVRWLAGRYGDLGAALAGELTALRDEARSGQGHARTPEAIANLGIGWRSFLRFAADCGALSRADAGAMWARVWDGLGEVGRRQAGHQADQEPTRRFLDLLASALASGEAHVAGADGKEPSTPERWGWREVTVGAGEYQRDEWRPQGRQVGWVVDDDLYLDMEATLASANKVGQATGSGVPVGAKTLAKRMHQRGLLASTEGGDTGGLTVRRLLQKSRRRVHHLRAGVVLREESGQSGRSGQHSRSAASAGLDDADDGRVSWPDNSNEDGESLPKNPTNPAGDGPAGRDGRIGRVSRTEATAEQESFTW